VTKAVAAQALSNLDRQRFSASPINNGPRGATTKDRGTMPPFPMFWRLAAPGAVCVPHQLPFINLKNNIAARDHLSFVRHKKFTAAARVPLWGDNSMLVVCFRKTVAID